MQDISLGPLQYDCDVRRESRMISSLKKHSDDSSDKEIAVPWIHIQALVAALINYLVTAVDRFTFILFHYLMINMSMNVKTIHQILTGSKGNFHI